MQEKLKGGDSEPELWPERVYQWGTSEAMNPQHSDLLLLRKLLLEEAVEEISHSKTHRYCPVPPLRLYFHVASFLFWGIVCSSCIGTT